MDYIKYKVVKPFTVFLNNKNEILDVVESSKKEQKLKELLNVFDSVKTQDFKQNDIYVEVDENKNIIEIALGENFMKITS